MKKIFNLFLILLISCNNNGEVKTKTTYLDGEKIVYEVNDKDLPNGKYMHYYKTGELKTKGVFKNGEYSNTDTLYSYYKNGKLKEKGIFSNGKKIGWWLYYDSLGNLEAKANDIWIDGVRHKNQVILYKNNRIDTINSDFVDIRYCRDDNKIKVHIQYYSPHKKDRSILYVIIDTLHSNFIVQNDTIYSLDDKNINFYIFPKKNQNNLKLKGKINEEYWGKMEEINKDSVELKYLIKTVFFDEKISKQMKKCKHSIHHSKFGSRQSKLP